VAIRPRGAGAEVMVPLTPAAQRRWRALGRIRLAAVTVTLACAVGAVLVPWAVAGVIVGGAFTVAASISLRTTSPRLRVRDGALQLGGVHPRFVTAVSAAPAAGCCGGGGGGGGAGDGGRGCQTCVSGCLPQVQLQD
jgi:hypothetical protein